MNNKLKNLLLSLSDKWPLVIAGLFSIGLIWFAYGCEPTTGSLLEPSKKVNRIQLETELDYLLSAHANRIEDLDKQAEFRQVIFEQTLLIAQGGPVNPLSVITGVLAIIGIGAGADDIRLRKQRKKQPIYESPEST